MYNISIINSGIEAIANILDTELPGRDGEDEEKNIWEVGRGKTKQKRSRC